MKKLLFLIFTSCIIFSCGTTDCNDFPKKLNGYLPYIKQQTIQFRNNQFDTLEFRIDSVYILPSVDFKNNCACECYTQKDIFINKDTIFNIKIEPGIVVSGNENEKVLFDLHINSDYAYFNNKSVVYSNDIAPLGDTVILEVNQGNNFSNITFVFNKGLVSFYDNRYKCTWKLVE